MLGLCWVPVFSCDCYFSQSSIYLMHFMCPTWGHTLRKRTIRHGLRLSGLECSWGVRITPLEMMLSGVLLALHVKGSPRSAWTQCWERVMGAGWRAQQHLLKSRTEKKASQGAEQRGTKTPKWGWMWCVIETSLPTRLEGGVLENTVWPVEPKPRGYNFYSATDKEPL